MADFAALCDQVFGLQTRFTGGRISSQAVGIIERLPIYIWPAGVSMDDQQTVLAFLTSYGRSDDKRPSAWATWTFSYIVLRFPEFQQKIISTNGREYEFVKLPIGYITAVKAVCREAKEAKGSDTNPKYAELLNQVPPLARFPEIPMTPAAIPPNFAACQTVPALYGYCSLLIFLAEKKINERNSITITECPRNLIDTYAIDEEAPFILDGEGQMNSRAHTMVNQSWVTYSGARIAIITEIAAFGAGTSLARRVVHTVTKLLEYSGMQMAYSIHRFLQAFPESATYSCVRPSLMAYISSVREVATAASHLQPYYKLIHGDSTRVFHRNSIRTLAACAIGYEKYTGGSMRNFVLGEGATAALAMYNAEAVRKGHRTIPT
jgi:hypothetical protein